MPTHSAFSLDAQRLNTAGAYQLEFWIDTTGFPSFLSGMSTDWTLAWPGY